MVRLHVNIWSRNAKSLAIHKLKKKVCTSIAYIPIWLTLLEKHRISKSAVSTGCLGVVQEYGEWTFWETPQPKKKHPTHVWLCSVGTADHVMLCHVPALRQKRAYRLVIAVPGLDHEPFERCAHVDGRKRDVHQVAWNQGRRRVHLQPVRTRHALRVFRLITRVPGRHVLARDLQHIVGDGPGAGSLDHNQQQRHHRRYDCPGRDRRLRTTGLHCHGDYRGTVR